MQRVLIVVPCYNEAARLDGEAFLGFAGTHSDIHFLFVNDGSTDGTRAVLEELRQQRPNQIALLHLPANVGKAEAIRQGMLQSLDSNSDAVGYWDADLSTPLDAIPCFRDLLERRAGVNIVLGTRLALQGRHIQRHWLRRILGRVFARCASHVIGTPIFDTQCGAKLFRVNESVRRLFLQPFLSRWIFDVELLVRWRSACRAGACSALDGAIYEFPLEEWHEVKGSKLKSSDFLRAVGELWMIHRRYARYAIDWSSPPIAQQPAAHSRKAA